MDSEPGLVGVHASFANLLESGLEVLTPQTPPAADDPDEPFAHTPRSVFSAAKYFRVVSVDGLNATVDDDPQSEPAGEVATGEVVEVLQVRNWSPENGGAVQPRYRIKKGWVSGFDDVGNPNLVRMQVATHTVRSRTWSEQKNRPRNWRDRSELTPTLSPVADEAQPSSPSSDLDTDASTDQSSGTKPSAPAATGDLESRSPPMLMGEWEPASAPCYAVPVPPPGGLPSPSPVQVRAFAGLTSRRCGILHPGEVIQIIETRMVDGVTRVRFRGGWVTLLDKPRTDRGSGASGTRVPLLEWTRAKPTKISMFRDPQLLATLGERLRQERVAAQQRKRQEHQELASAVLADGGKQPKAEPEGATGRPLSGKADAKSNIPPIVLTGVEPENIGEALQRGNKLTSTDLQIATGSAQSPSRKMLAQLYAGEGGPVDIRMIGAPRTPRSATTGAPAFRSYTFHVVERASNGRSIATFTQRYSRAKAVHEEMLGMGIEMRGCDFPVVVDDEENVTKRGEKLERYYQALFDLHWSNGSSRSVELLKEMLGTAQLLPAPERSEEYVANRATVFFEHLEAMQQAFQNYTTREGRVTLAPEHVLDLLAEMGVDFGPVSDSAVQAARDRAVEVLGGAGWAEIEAWYQDPTERVKRERAKAAAEAALNASAVAKTQQEAAGLNSADSDVDDIAALDEMIGDNQPSISSLLMQSVRETLAEPVATQLVRADEVPREQKLEEDTDLDSELQLMQATDISRQQRALAVGLRADATWDAIADAEVSVSLKADTDESPGGGVRVHGLLESREPDDESDDDGEFHDVEER